MNITGNELENIFIPEKRKICQTCHKIRIKALISKFGFDENNQQNIRFCQNHQSQNHQRHNHHQHDRQIQQCENHNQHDGQIPQHEEQNNLEKSVEEKRIEHNFETQKNNEGNQYATKREFNEFKEKITKEIREVNDYLKILLENLSRQIQDLKNKI